MKLLVANTGGGSAAHHQIVIVGPIGCRPYSGFSVFSFNFVFLLLLSTLSGIMVCHIAVEVRGLKCGDSKMVKARL